MTVFWTTFDSHAVLPWVVMLVATVGGFWLARRGWPDLRAAWDEANTMPTDLGNSLSETEPAIDPDKVNPVAEIQGEEGKS